MQNTSTVKAGSAFLAGVVIALGSAFVYYKTTDAHAKPAVQAAVAADSKSGVADLTPTPKATEAPAPVVEAPVAQPAPVAEPPVAEPSPVVVKSTPRSAPVVHKIPKPVIPKPRVTSRPVSLAVNEYPQNVRTVAQPQPAVPEPVQAPVPNPQPIPMAPPPPPPVAPPQPHTVTITAGTNIAIRLTEKLSTDHNYSGDTFRATLDAPIVMDGFIIADRGAKVLGRIVTAQKPGKMQGTAELGITLTEIATTDGQTMHVQTNQSLRKGPSNTGEDVAKMGGGAALGAIIGAIAGGGKGAAIGAGAGGAAGTGAVLLGHGKPAVMENETRLTFSLANPATLTEKLN